RAEQSGGGRQRQRQISERELDGRNDRHARCAAVLRGQSQHHQCNAPDDPAYARHPQDLTGNLAMSSPTISANAYANLARVLESNGAGKGAEAPGQSFAALLKDAVGSVMESGRKSDAQSVAMAAGKANVMDVVTAVAETDVAVSTLVSVRDRVIQSY